jgi:hydroxymethylglutaryl-CoA lyase
MPQTVKLIECPRDAMQGWKTIIHTEMKVRYINSLLKAGFDTLDFGSFVSPKAIPQMADTKDLVSRLELAGTNTKLLAIVANLRGAAEACAFEQVTYLGFPFSVSETFQIRNTNATIKQSLTRVEEIQALCQKMNKQLVIYISMAFGNPYDDPYGEEIVFEWVNRLIGFDITIISLADTVGLASAGQVFDITGYLVQAFPQTEIGVHLHSTELNRAEKIDAALQAGCRRFDGALKGIGGCPLAEDELVGNMNMEWMIGHFENKNFQTGINKHALADSLKIAGEIFS